MTKNDKQSGEILVEDGEEGPVYWMRRVAVTNGDMTSIQWYILSSKSLPLKTFEGDLEEVITRLEGLRKENEQIELSSFLEFDAETSFIVKSITGPNEISDALFEKAEAAWAEYQRSLAEQEEAHRQAELHQAKRQLAAMRENYPELFAGG